jgi:hypothetical protein
MGPGTDTAPLVDSTQILDMNLSSIGRYSVNQKGPPAAFKFKTRRFRESQHWQHLDRGLQLGPAWPQGRLGGVRALGRGLVNVPGLDILITPRLSLASCGLAGGRSAKRLFSFPRFRANRLSLAGSRRGLTMASTVRAHRLLPRRCRQHMMARDASSRAPVGFHARCNRELLTG